MSQRAGGFSFWLGVAIFALASGAASAANYYVDAQLSSNCSGNYSVANRNCSGSDGVAWANLDAYESGRSSLSPGDIVYFRPGQYWQTPSGGLAVSPGAPGNPIVYTTLPGEERQAEICTAAGKCQYNPNPTCGGGGSGCSTGNRYYPEAAIGVGAPWTEVRNLKSYGQTCISANNTLVEGNDLGGGGPSYCTIATNQGQVVAMYGTNETAVVRNNHIHHSTAGESSRNGACLMGYNFTATIENNTFYDCYEADVRLKDQTGHLNDQTIIRNNLFLPNNLGGGDQVGFEGCNQDCSINRHILYNNVFINKDKAMYLANGGANPPLSYNNTFVNSSEYDVGHWSSAAGWFHSFNNLHYTTRSTKIFGLSQTNIGSVQSDYNCHWTQGGGHSWQVTSTWSTFNQWRNQGKDANGTNQVNPNFVNAGCLSSGNCTAEDFKRSSYGENMSGSPYSARCGAYVTGNETIGADWSSSGGSSSTCGDNAISGGEACDGTNLGGQTCSSQGAFTGGTLTCLPDCSGFDVSSCTTSAALGKVQNVRFVN